MRLPRALTPCLAAQLALVITLVLGVRARAFPLGVPGEWEWLRLTVGPDWLNLGLAAVGLAAYASFVGLGFRLLAGRPTRVREGFTLSGLLAAAVLVQGVVQSGAPVGYNLAKWYIALVQRGSSGYFAVAKAEVRDAGEFVAAYPVWIRGQDALHIGTHPPGLVLTQHALIRLMEWHPGAARLANDLAPESVTIAARVFVTNPPLSPADRAVLTLTGALTLLACAATVVPLYALARAGLSAQGAWVAAALWPVVPAAVMFQPAADTAFPLLTTAALALAAWSGEERPRRGLALAALNGLFLALGMQFSLVFLPVGLIVGLLTVTARSRTLPLRLALLVATGAGFLGLTLAFWWWGGANPFAVWWWNSKNHARFYEQFPRGYAAWVMANPVELAVALGLPGALLVGAGLAKPRGVPRVAWLTLGVLAFLTLSGKTLSEVGRLWLPFLPALLVAAGAGLGRLGGGAKALAWSVFLAGVQALALESLIQVVYPV